MQAYFCVVLTGVKRLEWFVSRDPGYTLSRMSASRLLYAEPCANSTDAFARGDWFKSLNAREKRQFIQQHNPTRAAIEPPRIPVIAGGSGDPGSDALDQILRRLRDGSGRVTDAFRDYLRHTRDFPDDFNPAGGVRARLPLSPRSRPGADAVPMPTPTYWMDATQNGVSRAEFASPR